MRVRILRSRHLLNQTHQRAEATEGLGADSPEGGSEPDFAPRAAVSAGRFKDRIITRTTDSEDVILEDKVVVRIGSPADGIIVHIGGLLGDTVVLDGGPGMAFARGHSSFAPKLELDDGPDIAFSPDLLSHVFKLVRL